MNREKILDIAMKLPREAYIDLLCAGAKGICEDFSWISSWTERHPNISRNQALALTEACKERKEEEDERPGISAGTYCDPSIGR